MKNLEIKINITSEEKFVYTDELAIQDMYDFTKDSFFNDVLPEGYNIISEENIDTYKQDFEFFVLSEEHKSRAHNLAIMFVNKYRGCDVSKEDFTNQNKNVSKALEMLGVVID